MSDEDDDIQLFQRKNNQRRKRLLNQATLDEVHNEAGSQPEPEKLKRAATKQGRSCNSTQLIRSFEHLLTEENEESEGIKRSRTRNNMDSSTDDVTFRKGRIRDTSERTINSANSTRNPSNNDHVDNRFHQILLQSRSNNAFMNVLKSAAYVTKTQRFLSKTLLIQQMTPEELCGVCRDEDFERISVLGRGSNGIVEKQLFKPLEQEVAMKKLLATDQQDEFDSEVLILRSKPAEYLPKLIHYNRKNLTIYMELGMITMDDYDRYLRSKQSTIGFNDQFASWMLRSLLEINLRMYQENFHHSDIKPANVVFTFNQNQRLSIKLIDLGAASIYCEDYWAQFTPHFQSPVLVSKLTNANANTSSTEKTPENDQTHTSSSPLSLTREEIFYAEFFASCRSIQLLMLATHPKRTHLFKLESITDFLKDPQLKQSFPMSFIILDFVFNKHQKLLSISSAQLLLLILSAHINISQLETEIENVYKEA